MEVVGVIHNARGEAISHHYGDNDDCFSALYVDKGDGNGLTLAIQFDKSFRSEAYESAKRNEALGFDTLIMESDRFQFPHAWSVERDRDAMAIGF